MNTKALIGIVAVSGILAMAGLVSAGSPYFSWPGRAFAQDSPSVAVTLSPSGTVEQGTAITATMTFSGLAYDSDTSTTDYAFRADVTGASECEGSGLGRTRYMYRVDKDPETRTGTVSASCPAGDYTLTASISSGDSVELASASASFAVAAPAQEPTASPTASIALSPSDAVGEGAEITVTMSFGGLASDADTSTTDYTFRADVLDSDNEDADDCEGNGLGADRNINKVDEDPEVRTGTVSADCPAGDYNLKVSITTPEDLGLALIVPISIEEELATAQASHGTIVNICDRTPEVEDAILTTLLEDTRNAGVTCSTVTDAQLALLGGMLVEGYSSSVFLASDFAGLTGVTSFTIHKSPMLTTAPANAFSELDKGNVTSVWLVETGIHALHEDVFEGFSQLTELRLHRNRIKTLEDGVFDGLAALEILDISNNAITELDEDVFEGLAALTELALQQNDLTTVPEGVFDDLAALTKLQLAENPNLSTLPADVFDETTALTELSLGSNNFSTLPEDIFDGLVNLQQLWLHKNSLATLETGLFQPLDDSLTTLALGNNGLTTLHDDIFDGLTSLTGLYLNDNSLSGVNDAIFDDTTGLKWLFLHRNSIVTVHANAFDGLTALNWLYLNNNSIAALDATTFNDTTALTILGLSGNSISTLPANVFAGLVNLQQLWLHDNSFATLETELFDSLDASLTTLYLHDNDLTTLHEDIFDGLTGLTTLVLRGNSSLTSLHKDIFEGLANLAVLDAGKNSLTSLEIALFDPLDESLKTLYLTDNDIALLPADIFEGLTGLQRLDLSCNALTALDLGRFDPFAASLLYLDLSGNSFTTNPTISAVEAKLTAITNYISATEANTECLLPGDVGLSALTLDTGILEPFFTAPGAAAYNARVANNVTQVTLSITPNDPNAAVRIFGDTVDADSGRAGIQKDLNPGRNHVFWYIDAENGVSSKEYNVGVFREFAPATNARLRSLTLSGVTLAEDFNSRSFAYTGFAARATTESEVTPELLDSDATYVIKLDGVTDPDGLVSLAEGVNVITVEVTAEDGATTETYTTTVTRAGALNTCDTPPPADAIWSACLTVEGLGYSFIREGHQDNYGALSQTDFTIGGTTTYTIDTLEIENGHLYLFFTSAPGGDASDWVFHIRSGSTVNDFAFSTAAVPQFQGKGYRWLDSGLSWSEGDMLSVWLAAAAAGPDIVVAASKQVFDRPGGYRERDLIIALYNLEPDATWSWSEDNYSGDYSTLDYVHRTDILDADGSTTLDALDRRNECEGPALFERNHIQMSVDREIRKVNENPETRDGGVIETCANDFAVTVTVWEGAAYREGRGAEPVAQLTCRFDGSANDDFRALDWAGEQTGPGWYYHEYVLCTDTNRNRPDSMPTIPDLDWEPPEE